MIDLPPVTSFYYLATPYGKYPKGIWQAWADACAMAAWLVERKIPVFCPIAESHPIAMYGHLDPMDHEIWLPNDRPKMDAAGGLIIGMLETWESSYGVGVETRAFAEEGKPIRYMTWPEVQFLEKPP